jgi:hypothetical protein
MLYKIPLKNADKSIILDENIKKQLEADMYLTSLDFLQNLREHSSGYAVFQKMWKQLDGSYKLETIYLHRYIAEHFLPTPAGEQDQKWHARVVNGNKLDCRLRNLEWCTKGKVVRKGKTYSKTGYRGVRKEGNMFRVTIYVNRKAIHVGMFATAEEAALAYNAKSKEFFGNEGKLNSVVAHP